MIMAQQYSKYKIDNWPGKHECSTGSLAMFTMMMMMTMMTSESSFTF